MADQSHRKSDPVPTPAITTHTPTAEQAQDQRPAKPTREKGDKPDTQPTEE